MISYHFYAVPTPDQGPEVMQYTYWTRPTISWKWSSTSRTFARGCRRKHKQPLTNSARFPRRLDQDKPGHVTKPILTLTGISVASVRLPLRRASQARYRGVGESALAQLPTFSQVSAWLTGNGTAECPLLVLKLLRDNFGPAIS